MPGKEYPRLPDPPKNLIARILWKTGLKADSANFLADKLIEKMGFHVENAYDYCHDPSCAAEHGGDPEHRWASGWFPGHVTEPGQSDTMPDMHVAIEGADAKALLHQYSEWLDSEMHMMPLVNLPVDTNLLTHDDLVAEFLRSRSPEARPIVEVRS